MKYSVLCGVKVGLLICDHCRYHVEAIALAKKAKLVNSKVVAGSPHTFSLRMYFLLDMQPGNCHGDYLIVVDRRWL